MKYTAEAIYGIWNGRKWMRRSSDGLPLHATNPNVLRAYLHNVAQENLLPDIDSVEIRPIGPDGLPGEEVTFKG